MLCFRLRAIEKIAHGQAVFFVALTLAHRARCADAIFLRAAADRVRFLGSVTTFPFPLLAFNFAHRALCAAAIRARPDADICRRTPVCFPYAEPKAANAAEMRSI